MDHPLENAERNRQPPQSDESVFPWERYIALPAVLILIGWWVWARLLGY